MTKEKTIFDETEEKAIPMPTEAELKQLGLLYCKITDISPNSGGQKGEKSFTVNLSIGISAGNPNFVEIIPDKVKSILKSCNGDYPFDPSLPFKITGGANVILTLRKFHNQEPFFSSKVTLNASMKLRPDDKNLKWEVSYRQLLEDIKVGLLYELFEVAGTAIFCSIEPEQLSIGV